MTADDDLKFLNIAYYIPTRVLEKHYAALPTYTTSHSPAADNAIQRNFINYCSQANIFCTRWRIFLFNNLIPKPSQKGRLKSFFSGFLLRGENRYYIFNLNHIAVVYYTVWFCCFSTRMQMVRCTTWSTRIRLFNIVI